MLAKSTNRSFRLPRLWSNSVLKDLGPIFSGQVINVSGWDDRDKQGNHYKEYFPKATDYFISNYTGERGMDDAKSVTDFAIDLSVPLPTEFIQKFDVVLNHTTLEHIFDVTAAFRNLCQMSRDIVIIIVPFAQEVHYNSSYGDYWRFTPMSLRRLFQENEFEIVYEAASPYSNAGVYLLTIGSSHPDRWQNRLPPWQPIEQLGGWIGHSKFRRLANKFKSVKTVLSCLT